MLLFGLRNLKFRTSTFILYSIISIFSVPSRLIQSDSSLAYIFGCLAIGTVVTFFALPLLWFICILNQKYELGKKNVFYPLGLLLAVGAIRGAFLHSVIQVMSLEDNLQPIWAILSSTVFTFIYFTIISSFMEIILQRRERFDQLFAEASLMLASSGAKSDDYIDAKNVYNETLKSLKERISPFDLGEEDVSPDTLLAASKAIQIEINEVLRPMSHRLWINALGQVKHRNILGILKDSVVNLDFNMRNILVYQFFIGGYGISLVLGIKSAIFISAISVSVSFALMSAYHFITSHFKSDLFLAGVTFLILEGLLPVFAPIAINNPLNDSASWIAGLLIAPTLPGLILALSSYKLIMSDRDLAISAASSIGWRVSKLPLSEKDHLSGIELAEFFHNSLQSELYGISKRLESAAAETGSNNKQEIVQSLEKALSRDFQEISNREMDGNMRIENLIDSWRGIAEISVSGLSNLETDSGLAYRTSQVLEEMITNTIRYGEASQIEVSLDLESNGLKVFLTHNGQGPISRKPGLGSFLISHHADAGIEIGAENGKTFISIKLPIIK